ncbi:MAG: hypothetical protein AAF226_18490 [Verrucomicrobiota bacterium]
MNRYLSPIILIIVAQWNAFAQEASTQPAISVVPSQKRALKVSNKEPNPFSSIVPVEQVNYATGEHSSEQKVRLKLQSLAVKGASKGPEGWKVLLEDIVLQEGYAVPQVIPNQTSRLVVEKIEKDSVKFVWIDPHSGTRTQKKFTIDYDLSPKVGFVLNGQPGGDGQKQMGTMTFSR